MSDLMFRDIETVQSDKNQPPVTIASTTTIAPSTFLSVISGTTAVAAITPPVTGSHMLCFVHTTTTPTAYTTSGNIANVATPTTNVPIFAVYNPLTAKYHLGNTVS